MTFATCPDCKTFISYSALRCPKCGASIGPLGRDLKGRVAKYSFIGFNAAMFAWFLHGVVVASQYMARSSGDAERVGAAIGSGIGVTMIVGIWAAGALALGALTYLTRPKR